MPSSSSSSSAGWGQPPYAFITPEELRTLLKSKDRDWLDCIVIDVRDSDFIGGHIKGCRNIPAVSLHEQLRNLVLELKDFKRVIFHCALSQQRGPSAALSYSRARQRKMTGFSSPSRSTATPNEAEASSAAAAGLSTVSSPTTTPAEELPPQDILVLRGGFKTFAGLYGDDPDLVEDFDRRLW